MATGPIDLLVIGAGITGAGIARDAAMRGIRTAVIDKGDFASGTSSHSSRLVHGGLRYLEHRHFGLVFEASRERHVLLKIAPHLVWPQSFLFPIHEGARVSRLKLAAGLWLYDVLAIFRNVRRHRVLTRKAMKRAEPRLKDRGLKGGARYYDAQCDDARLTLATVRSAHRHGALAANYLEVEQLDIADGRVRGAVVTDLVTGRECTLHAQIVGQLHRSLVRPAPITGWEQTGVAPDEGCAHRCSTTPDRQPGSLDHYVTHRRTGHVHHPVGGTVIRRNYGYRLSARS
jgi:glycerol-3-phosphate dehydrogenase